MMDMLNQVFRTLMALDTQKKIALGAAFTITLAAVIFISFQASKPATAPLYSNLSREDLNNMSRILSENGIEFMVFSERGAIEVATAMTGQARMLLAERGLPSTEKSGYELFDQVNTLGLTSFMQGVTNKRGDRRRTGKNHTNDKRCEFRASAHRFGRSKCISAKCTK